MLFTSIGHLNDNEVYQLVRKNIHSCRMNKPFQISDRDIHHNTGYKNLNNVLRYGLLSFDEMVRRGIIHNEKQSVDNVNGDDGISVSKNVEIYPSEDFYDPNIAIEPDLIIDGSFEKNHLLSRNSINYGNEFIIRGSVPIEYVRAITIRFLSYLSNRCYSQNRDEFIRKYNHLVDCLEKIDELGIELVENSEEQVVIDKRKLLSYGKFQK